MQSLKVWANLNALEVIGDYVTEAAEQAGLDQKVTYGLCLAVDEIATNIIMHGYGYREDSETGLLELQAHSDHKWLSITLEDTAAPYDSTRATPPDLSLPPEQRLPGGLGIYLAIRSVDAFQYERIGKCNRNIFKVKRLAVSDKW